MKLTQKEILELRDKVKSLPYFNSQNVKKDGLYTRLAALKRVIENDKVADRTLINKGNITGLWYLTGLYFDEGNPQLLMRTSVKSNTMDGLYLNAAIFDFVHHDVIWKYDEHLIGGDCEIVGEIRAGRALTVYDAEREQN